jgi:hypothetical protein
MVSLLKKWNDKYDIWSFFSDFLFVFGVLVLDWSPILLILLLIIDITVMLLFVNILIYLELKDFLKTFIFLTISPFFIAPVVAMYLSLPKFLEDIHMDKIINSDPAQIINSYILPFILVSSALNHYSAFSKSLERIKKGTYKGQFIKHFFLKNIFAILSIMVLAFGHFFFNATIVLALIVGKMLLRSWNQKYREMF